MHKVTIHDNWPVWGHSIIAILGGGKAFGVVSITNAQPDIAVIEGLSVLPEYQRQGLGDEILGVCEEQARQHGVSTLRIFSEVGSFTRAWYIRRGYNEVGKINDYICLQKRA